MSFTKLLQELHTLTVAEQQALVRRARELDDSALSPTKEALVERWLEQGRQQPNSAVPLDEMKARLRGRFRR